MLVGLRVAAIVLSPFSSAVPTRMPAIPKDAFSAAEFLIRHMYRSFEIGEGHSLSAIAETEKPMGGDTWFWSDDNAKALEFLSRPELWRLYSREVVEIIRFVQAMCAGPFIFRRVGLPRLDRVEIEGHGSEYRHSFLRLAYQPALAAVVVALRFHDERNFDHLSLAGNYVEFTYRQRRFNVPVETAISDVSVAQNGTQLTVSCAREMRFKSRLREISLGFVAHSYTIDAGSMVIRVEAALDVDPGLMISDVVLTIGHSALNQSYYNTIVTDGSGNRSVHFMADAPTRERLQLRGTSYYQMRSREISGDSLAVHTLVRNLGNLLGLDVDVRPQGFLHQVIARYEFPGPHRGTRLIVTEDKVLTGGGLYDRISDYVALVRQAPRGGSKIGAVYDLSTSYDYGAKINAFAKCYAVCARCIDPEPASLIEELRHSFDRYLDYYFELFIDRHTERPNAIFSRDLAFVILGLATMYRATEVKGYLQRLRELCDILLGFEYRFDDLAGNQASGFLMRMNSPPIAYVDCHAAALLALTHATRFIDDPRLPAAIERGLRSYGIATCVEDIGDRMVKVDTVTTTMIHASGQNHAENSFWNFKAGMTLRCFSALCASPNPALQAIVQQHGPRLELLKMLLLRQISASITGHMDGVEVRTSVYSGETNSETQPWVMLGLLGHPAD